MFSSFIVVYSGRPSPVAVTPLLSEGMFLQKLPKPHIHLGGCQVGAWDSKIRFLIDPFFPTSHDRTMAGPEISGQFLSGSYKAIHLVAPIIHVRWT